MKKQEKEMYMYCAFAFLLGYVMCMYFPVHGKGSLFEGMEEQPVTCGPGTKLNASGTMCIIDNNNNSNRQATPTTGNRPSNNNSNRKATPTSGNNRPSNNNNNSNRQATPTSSNNEPSNNNNSNKATPTSGNGNSSNGNSNR